MPSLFVRRDVADKGCKMLALVDNHVGEEAGLLITLEVRHIALGYLGHDRFWIIGLGIRLEVVLFLLRFSYDSEMNKRRMKMPIVACLYPECSETTQKGRAPANG